MTTRPNCSGATLFGSSSDILRHMTGDCSEAAVLTAAMLRAKGIPARVSLGMVHFDSGVFTGHAWPEAWLGKWTALDPALRQYPAGALRIKFADLDQQQDLRIKAANIMLKMISNLEIEILEVWQKDRKVPLVRKDNRKISAKLLNQMFKFPDK